MLNEMNRLLWMSQRVVEGEERQDVLPCGSGGRAPGAGLGRLWASLC